MAYEHVSPNHVPPALPSGAHAEIHLFSVALGEGGFVKHTDLIKTCSANEKTMSDADRDFNALAAVREGGEAVEFGCRDAVGSGALLSWITRDRPVIAERCHAGDVTSAVGCSLQALNPVAITLRIRIQN